MTADPDILGFESLAKSNGGLYWSARKFAKFLGYSDYKSFRRVIDRAVSACMRLRIPVTENFLGVQGIIDDQMVTDTKLSRFACYLVAMNADSRKEKVAKAQVYLAGLADSFREYLEASEDVDRLVIRGDIADEEKTLSAVAHSHAVLSYPFFQNAGYRGMYNMNLIDLKQLKQMPSSRSPLDFMYSTELAANLFRITQTKEKIQNEGITGQANLERAHQTVGRTIRNTMQELSGTLPETLPTAPDIKATEKRLRDAHRTLKKLDAPNRAQNN